MGILVLREQDCHVIIREEALLVNLKGTLVGLQSSLTVAVTLLNYTQVVEDSDLVPEDALQLCEGVYCLLALAQLLKGDRIVRACFLVGPRLNQMLVVIFGTFLHSKEVVITRFLDLPHLVVDHTHVVVGFRELGLKEILLLLAISLDALLEGIESLWEVVGEL